MATAQERRAAQRRTAKAIKAGQNPLKGEFGGIAKKKAANYITPKTSRFRGEPGEPVESYGRTLETQTKVLGGAASLPAAPEPALPHLLTGIGSGGKPSGPNLQMSAARNIGAQFAAQHPHPQAEVVGAGVAGLNMTPSGPAMMNFPGMVGKVRSQPGHPSLPGVKPLTEGPFQLHESPIRQHEGFNPEYGLTDPRPIVNGAKEGAMHLGGREIKNNNAPAAALGSKQISKSPALTIAESMMRGHQRHVRMHGNGGYKISDFLAKATASPLPDKGVTV